MELNEKQTKQIQDFCESEAFRKGKCPICGKDEFELITTVFKLYEFNKPNTPSIEQKHSQFPVIPIVCKNCGYTMFISPLASGIDLLEQEENS